MNYKEAVDYIKNIGRIGVELGLERMRELLDLLGSPDERLRCVHIAGTNGKGSVSAYLTSVFRAAGMRVGTYNSPSVFCYNERWLIDGQPISDGDVARFMSAVREAIDNENKMREALGLGSFTPTAFEIETAIAFLAFCDFDCDVCVIETGMGGRWDATNAMSDKLLSVITPIGLDHCDYLGNTLGEIAAEKAAIIRGDAATVEQSKEIMAELRRPYLTIDGKRVEQKCRLTVAKAPKLLSDSLAGQTFAYGDEAYFIKMLGAHQLQNASLAICAAKLLSDRLGITDEDIKRGLADTVWHGRFEVVNDAKERFGLDVPDGKTLVFDGAHNPHGAQTLAAAIKEYFAGKSVHLVTGVLKDKDAEGIMRILAPLAKRVTAVTPPSPRALSGEELLKIANKYAPSELGKDVHGAVQEALAGDCEVVLLAGSLTLFESVGRE